MFKKIVSLLIVFTMLVPFSSVVAADNSSVQPTIDEILNSYHEKAFAASMQEGEASTYARRSGSEKTLEQETVDELTAAGYEAYNVTAENYEELEESLKMDFTEMELDPDSSYIMVISGEESNSAGNNSRVAGGDLGSLPEQDIIDDGGSSTFTYYEDGIAYTMRYVTVTSADTGGALFVTSAHLLSNIDYIDEIGQYFGEYFLEVAAEQLIEAVVEEGSDSIPYVGTICSVISLLVDVGVILSQDALEQLDPGTLDFRAYTIWTRSYIQVRNSDTGHWHTAQCSSHAVSEARFIGDYIRIAGTNDVVAIGGIIQSGTVDSPYYTDFAHRKARAVDGYLNEIVLYDCTGSIDFYFTNPNSDDPDTSRIYLFSHHENVSPFLPFIEES